MGLKIRFYNYSAIKDKIEENYKTKIIKLSGFNNRDQYKYLCDEMLNEMDQNNQNMLTTLSLNKSEHVEECDKSDTQHVKPKCCCEECDKSDVNPKFCCEDCGKSYTTKATLKRVCAPMVDWKRFSRIRRTDTS